MKIELMKANPFVEQAWGRVCIKRGPLVYCLESVDLPDNVNISEICLLPDINLQAQHKSDFLGGVTVLKGKAYRKTTDWDGDLYQKVQKPQEEMIPVTFIPYYSWCNRGASEMTVWLPIY